MSKTFTVGDRVRCVVDLRDDSGDSPEFMIPNGTEGVIASHADSSLPMVDFGAFGVCPVRHEEIELIG